MLECFLIADDLTGACDAAAPFAAAGLRTIVPLAGWIAEDADVVACSTESRNIVPAAARGRLCAVVAAVRRYAPRIIFKKIDSTLRGNTAHEIVAALDIFGCAAAAVTPAFPAAGRVVESGRLRLTNDSGFAPVELAEWLRAHGAISCVHADAGAIAAAVRGGARFVTLDAACAGDLESIAAELLDVPGPILWAGSAGLAHALAARLRAAANPPEPHRERGEVLFCIGSPHPVTVGQQQTLLAERPRARLVRIPRGQVDEAELRRRIETPRPAALFLSGGDTASLVCRALNVHRIELRREFAPGVPLGVLRGGSFDGVAVVTKSGGFGDPDLLVSIADYFHD